MGGLANRECPLLRELLRPILEGVIKQLLEQCNEQSENVRQRGGFVVDMDENGITVRFKNPKPEGE